MTTYKYYQLIETEEHCLYPAEVCELWGLRSISSIKSVFKEELPYYMVIALLKETELSLGKSPIYYLTSTNGLSRVYDHETINQAAMYLGTNMKNDNGVYTIHIGKKNYKFVSSEEVDAIAQRLYPEYFEKDGTPISLKDIEAQIRRKAELKGGQLSGKI